MQKGRNAMAATAMNIRRVARLQWLQESWLRAKILAFEDLVTMLRIKIIEIVSESWSQVCLVSVMPVTRYKYINWSLSLWHKLNARRI